MRSTAPIRHRQIVVDAFGGPDRLRLTDTVTPPPREGHARVKVLAIGVGYTDLMARRGEYVLQRKRPFIPGYELVGEIVDYRADPARPAPQWLHPGVRVAACLLRMGAYTEFRTLPLSTVVPVPANLDSHVAAAIPLDYLTAVSLLERHGRVQPGDAVLIHGATGGVGDALCQLGSQQQLTMYGTASGRSIERLDRYDITSIDYESERVEAVVRQHRPDGLQAVFDHIGGNSLRANHRLLATGGVLASYAFAGRPGHILADTVRGAVHNRLLGLLPGKRTALCTVPREIRTNPTWYRDTLARLLDLAHTDDIHPHVGAVRPLAHAAAVHAELERREITGKVVLVTE
jgi:NADPH2:quinone reductase